MAKQKAVPARVTVLLARDARVGVIFRRGPKWRTQLIRWDTKTDEFEFGQWFHGHIEEYDADLSPDGRLLAYFAGKPRKDNQERWYWNAISRPPYFTALALWFRSDRVTRLCPTFVSNQRIAFLPERPPDEGSLPEPYGRDLRERAGHRYKLRQNLNGWLTEEDCPQPQGWPDALRSFLGCRPQPRGKATLWHINLVFPGEREWKSRYLVTWDDQFEWSNLLALPWADWDQRGRLVYVQDGCLYSQPIDDFSKRPKLLADLNETPAETGPAPDWAREWPK